MRRTWPEEPQAAQPRASRVEVVLVDGPLRGRRYSTTCAIIETLAVDDAGVCEVVRYRVNRDSGTARLIRPAPPALRWWRKLLARVPLLPRLL